MINKFWGSSSVSALALAISVFGSGSALAQPTTTQPFDASATDDGSMDIVVTAQKREQNVQDVPASVTALGSEALANRQVESLTDLVSQVPSLKTGLLFGANQITLRGISTGATAGTGDPSVATHIDGVYQPRDRSIDIAMIDLERVEVLSGPQGTLYGRNATGGVVNYVLRKPSENFEGEITGRVANYGRYALQGSISIPLSGKAGVRITGLYDNQSEGFTKVLNTDAPVDSLEKNKVAGGRIIAEFRPSDAVTIDLQTMYMDTKSSTGFFPFGRAVSTVAAENTADTSIYAFKPHQAFTNTSPYLNNRFWQSIGTLTWELSPELTLKSITAYQTLHTRMKVDNDFSAAANLSIVQRLDSESFTEELNLNADLMDGRLQSIFGLFYFNDRIDIDTDNFVGGPFLVELNTKPARAESYAFFMDHTFSVSDNFRLMAGIRYNDDKKSVLQNTTMFNGSTTSTLFPLTLSQKSFNNWSPRFGFQYDFSSDVMGYAQFSKGYKSGGFNANVIKPNPFNPETIDGYEAGVKSTLADGDVIFNLAGYYYTLKNLQVQGVFFNPNPPPGTSDFQVRNAADSEIYGLEAQFRARISSALTVDASGVLQSAKYNDFITCDTLKFVSACGTPSSFVANSINVKGNWLSRAPNYTLNLGLEYRTEVLSGANLLIRGESLFSGKVYYDQFNLPLSTQGEYSLQNAYATLTTADEKFDIRVYVKNIGNVAYKAAGFAQSSRLLQTGTWGPPRTYGIDVTAHF